MEVGKPASILLADDERNIRLMLRTVLESDGYTIAEAADGRETLALLKRSTPDLLILDLNMPVLDGMAVLEELNAPAAPYARPQIVILTAHGSIAAAVQATRLGAVDFLEKPITPAELRKSVSAVLHEGELRITSQNARGKDEYDSVVERIRKSLRLADFTSAETLLTRVAERREQHSAEYFNLLGILYEVQRKWRLAQKCYGKAMKADKHYDPAHANMKRIYELQTFGHSTQCVVLGDEPTTPAEYLTGHRS